MAGNIEPFTIGNVVAQVATHPLTDFMVNANYKYSYYGNINTAIPDIDDKWIEVGTSLSTDGGNSWVVPSFCYINTVTTWDDAVLLNDDALPTGLVFTAGTSTFSGTISSEGIYTVKLRKTITNSAVTNTASAIFNIHVYNNAPNATGTLANDTVPLGVFYLN